MLSFKTLALLLVAILATLAVACGDDDDDGDSGDNGGATDAPTATDDAGGGGEELNVIMEGTAFDPEEFSVLAGVATVIAVDNLDAFTHTLTVYNDEEFTDPQGTEISLDGNESGEIEATFEAATYFFRCEIHPGAMQGTFTAE